MSAIRLDAMTQQRLAQAAARLGETPDAIATRAVGSYLEDLDDYTRAAAAWAELDRSEVRSLDEMKQELGLAH